MTYLLLSILCSSAIFIIFKLFQKYKVDTFTAIVINYFIASITGVFTINGNLDFEYVAQAPWIYNAVFLGIIFIALFNLMALTAQKLGPSVASIANKMALIIPVVFAVFYYNDSINILKIIGIALALIGVSLSTYKEKVATEKVDKWLLIIPLIVFLGSGFIDTFLKYNQEFYLNKNLLDAQLFPSVTFITAFTIGLVVIIAKGGKKLLHLPTVIGGVTLGVINYGSIFFLIEIFNHSDLESSVVFPINNMGVVLMTALTSLFIFKERFTTKNKIGIALSILALLAIIFSK